MRAALNRLYEPEIGLRLNPRSFILDPSSFPTVAMPTKLDTLLKQLNSALSDLDAARVRDLVRQIRQLLFAEQAELDDVEAQLREALRMVEHGLARASLAKPASSESSPVKIRDWTEQATKVLGIGAKPNLAPDGRICSIWFASNRKAEGRGFGPQRAMPRDALSLGRVDVWVPAAHKLGQTGSSYWNKLKRFDFTDDTLRVHSIETLNPTDFWSAIQAAIADGGKSGASGAGEGDALLYLHGYNSSFDEAAIRAAQLHVDLQVSGVTAFFSWPSRATLKGYTADEASIEASEAAITQFLRQFVRDSGAKRVHLIAHSMGNRGLLRALQRIAADVAAGVEPIRFGQIFLAAPDVDRDLFLDLAKFYPQFAERTTLYASPADRAVFASSVLHDAPRAGYFHQAEQQTVAPGIDSVMVPDLDFDWLGHSYYAEAEALLTEIFNLIHGANIASVRRRAVLDGLFELKA